MDCSLTKYLDSSNKRETMNDDAMEVCEGGLSRRRLLLGTGAVATTAVLAQLGGWLRPANATGGSTEKWPWPYEKLDPATTAELAYKEWYRVFCGCAVISSVFSQLREKIGEPYTSFPVDAFVFLEGGVVGWGTVCGTNAGANIVANLIIGPKLAGSDAGNLIGAEMMQWYCDASMPVFLPKEPKVKNEIVQTISESPLCHVSVGKWMAVADKPLGSPERRDRCARVAASVAYHLVELLNSWKDGKYEAEVEWTPVSDHGINAQPNCMECHGHGVPRAPMTKS